MPKRLGHASAAFVLLIATLAAIVSPSSAAYAYASYSTTSWPSGLQLNNPAQISAHGNGSVSLATRSCDTTNAPTEVTISADHTHQWTVLNGTDTAHWCVTKMVAGPDSTVYYAFRNSSTGETRVVARHNNAVLWFHNLSSVSCFGHPAYYALSSMALGFDGNLYLIIQSSCTSSWTLQSLNGRTGALRYSPVPGIALSYFTTGNLASQILTYNGGVAIVGDDAAVHYYNYAGGSGATSFAPSVPSGTSVVAATGTADGRVYVVTQKYDGTLNKDVNHVYDRDLTGTTINEVTYPSNVTLSPGFTAATPSDGVVLQWVNSSSTQYFGYFDSSGSMTYSQSITVNTSTLGLTVDDSGNVIVQRTVMLPNNDRDVIVESYSPTGTLTSLFDAVSAFDTSGIDTFVGMTQPSPVDKQYTMGDGQYYLVLCRHSGTSGSTFPACNLTTDSPTIVSLSLSGSDYPPSAVFASAPHGLSYVAMGDSYSAGEANPPFLEGTDGGAGGDGCDRSTDGYPVQLAAYLGYNLNGFVACSGAMTGDLSTTFKGEPSQLNALSDDTDLVTLTIGGNDIDFVDFATQCVMGPGSCDSSSPYYAYSASVIVNTLPGHLDTLFDAIASDAPNAQVYVVGYPYVAPPVGTSCTDFTNSEEQAAKDIEDGLNVDLYNATLNQSSNFHFIDPTAAGSPFLGNELCSTAPAFTGVSLPTKFSFHPNLGGMGYYEELISSSI